MKDIALRIIRDIEIFGVVVGAAIISGLLWILIIAMVCDYKTDRELDEHRKKLK